MSFFAIKDELEAVVAANVRARLEEFEVVREDHSELMAVVRWRREDGEHGTHRACVGCGPLTGQSMLVSGDYFRGEDAEKRARASFAKRCAS